MTLFIVNFATTARKCPFNFRYAVFGLGSSSYPMFAAFGKYLDDVFDVLGGERLLTFATGDEVTGQMHAFEKWSQKVLKVSQKK